MSKDVFMERAYELALKGFGKTSPNPCVGAVVVKNGRIVGEGWHMRVGGDHAEVVALKDVNVSGCTLFVTLEPCCHHGKTPPCTDLILKSGIKKVVVGMLDPFSKVSGKGLEVLRAAGLDVEIYTGELELKIRDLNQPFIKINSVGFPYVTLKAGMSFDGKIANRSRQSKWITDEGSRRDSKAERLLCDAVLVGFGTVDSDDPELAGAKRIILDKNLKLNLKKKVFRDKNVFVATSDLANEFDKKRFSNAGIEFKSFGKKDVSIASLLKFLAKKGIQSVFVEGGSGVHGAFYDAFLKNPLLLDKVIFYIAPKILGGRDSLPVVGGFGVKNLDSAPKLLDFHCEKLEEDLKVIGRFNFY